MQLTFTNRPAIHFTRQHYVEWYDLQSELVDHLSRILLKRMAESERTFEEAFNIEFKKFGVFGLWTLLKTTVVLAKNTIQLFGSISKIFLVFKIILQ
jgi:hypothetical protein